MKKILLLLTFISVLSGNVNGQVSASDSTSKTSSTLTVGMDSLSRAKDSVSRSSMLSFGPPILDFKIGRGQSKTETFYIINRKNHPYSFNLSLSDFTFDSAHSMTQFPPNSQANSCADWITLDKTFIEVPANSAGRILVTMNVPDKPEADLETKWAALNVNIVTDPTVTKGKIKGQEIKVSITPELGVGVQLYCLPPTAVKDLKLISFDRKNDSTFHIKCNNAGKARLECKMSVELSAVNGDFKHTINEEGVRMLPGHMRVMDMKIPNSVPAGKYNVVAIIDALDDEVPLEAAQMQIEVVR